MTVTFRLDGQEFMGLNGGPVFTFSPAVSFIVNCKTQKELDRFWNNLSAGGKEVECGWLTDKYGVSWQIVPAVLGKMLKDKDATKTEGVMSALLQMRKLDIDALQRAYRQPSPRTRRTGG
jgi:predicted 3-demethylubiquinone-9 3-methyltransferase (glyoxalase superfamily)